MQATGPSGIDGIPAQYDDGVQWLRNGFRRHPAAVWIALVFGWTGVWVAFWGAMIGVCLGLFIAIGVETDPTLAHDFFNLGIGQSVTVLSVVAASSWERSAASSWCCESSSSTSSPRSSLP